MVRWFVKMPVALTSNHFRFINQNSLKITSSWPVASASFLSAFNAFFSSFRELFSSFADFLNFLFCGDLSTLDFFEDLALLGVAELGVFLGVSPEKKNIIIKRK